jgi:hypothetical protein
MKTILHSALLVAVALTVMAFSARADLITGTDPGFGANSLTIDTQTGLAWLNLSYTTGLSYDQVLADMQPGGMFSNYTFATAQQVTDLFTDAGVGPAGNYPLSMPAILNLISLVGSTGPINGNTGFIAISATPGGFGTYEDPSIYAGGLNGIAYYFVAEGGIGTTDTGPSVSDPNTADWLIQAVPEPGTGSVAIAGFAAVLFTQRWRTRANELAVRADV